MEGQPNRFVQPDAGLKSMSRAKDCSVKGVLAAATREKKGLPRTSRIAPFPDSGKQLPRRLLYNSDQWKT
jgi:hypothetical protein